MQILPQKKQQKIVENLIQIDRDLQQINIDRNESSVRHLIDHRRQLLANLRSLQPDNETPANSPGWPKYTPTIFSTELMQKWRSRVTLLKSEKQSFEDPDFCNQILDNILPEAWNFDSDVIVVSAPPSSTIALRAIDRKQRYIVIFDHHKSIDEDTFACHTTANVVICTTIKDVEIAFAKLQTPADQVITLPCSLDPLFNAETKDHLAEAIRKGKKNRIANTNTANKFGLSWSKNLLQNAPILLNSFHFKDISIRGVEHAIIVASGPSLDKNIGVLKSIQNKVFIVSALRSVPTLKTAGVEPDLVIQLDAEDNDSLTHLGLDENIKIKNLLLELTVNNKFLQLDAENLIWSCPSLFTDFINFFEIEPTPFDAPSVAIYGLSLCHVLGFKSLCFIGHDLAASDGSQYAAAASSILPVHAPMSSFNIEVKGFYGGTVKTRSAYFGQIKRCETIARNLSETNPETKLFNATEGGAYIDGFTHTSLSNFVESNCLFDQKTKKTINLTRQRAISKIHIDEYLKETTAKLKKIIEVSDEIIRQAESQNPKSEKTNSLILKFQKLNSSTSILQIAMQQEISSVLGTSINGKKDTSLAEFFRLVSKTATELRTSIINQHPKTRIY